MYIFLKSFKLLTIMTLLLGLIYPFVVLMLGNLMFQSNSKGSLLFENEQIVGSAHIGQSFSKKGYFINRASASNYDSMASGGTNLAQTNPKLKENIEARKEMIVARFQNENIPMDLLTSSSSGLDPHISKASAIYQINTIAKERNIEVNKLEIIVQNHIENKFLGILGEEIVNVLKLNMTLDKEFGKI